MPRKNPNKSFYNYSIKEFDESGNIENISFFMTHYEIMEKYNISCPTIYRHLKLKKPIKKLNHIKIEKVRVPVYKRVVNDVFSHNILDYNSDESSADYSEYETYLERKNDKKYVEEVLDGENGEKIPIYTYN